MMPAGVLGYLKRPVAATAAAILLLAAPTAGEPFSIDDVAFIAGHWVGTGDGGIYEEIWLPPAGKMLVGLHRDVKDDGRVFFEFLRIEARGDGIYYVAKPSNQPETEFRLDHAAADADGVSPAGPPADGMINAAVRFSNPDHDFPQEIIYELMGDGALRASIHGAVGGKERWVTWVYRRAESGGGP